MERESFVFYRSFYEASKFLSNEDKWKLFDMICQYWLYWNEIELEWPAMWMFLLIKPQLDANNRRYENWCKGGQYWIKGWRPPKDWGNSQKPQNNPKETPSEPQANPNLTPNVNVNVNVNENVNENENVNVNENEKPYRLPAKAGREGVGKKFDVLSLIHIEWETEEEKQELDEAWKAYKEMRKKIKKPLTEYAEKLRANDLVKLWATTKERVAILNQSIASWWQDLYELKDKPRPKLKWNMYH